MKKKIFSKNGMKQIINSGWKEFDNQTNCITTGNVIANTQYSSFIRPWKERECNNNIFPEGDLMRFDIEHFGRLPEAIDKYLRDKNRQDSVILYEFFTTNKYGRRCPFCWVITDRDYKLIMYRISVHCRQHLLKRLTASREAINYITA